MAIILADLVAVSRPILASAFPFNPQVVMRDLRRFEDFTQIVRLPVYGEDGVRNDLDWFDFTPIEDVPVDVSYSALYPALLTNRGTIWAYEAIPIKNNAVPSGYPEYRGEVYLQNGLGQGQRPFLVPLADQAEHHLFRVDGRDGQADRLPDSQSIGVHHRETAAIERLFQGGDQAAAIFIAADVEQPLLAWLADFFFVNSAHSQPSVLR